MFHLANLENIVSPRKVLCVVGIAILHIVASGFDQFIANVFKGEGLLHQVSIYNTIWIIFIRLTYLKTFFRRSNVPFFEKYSLSIRLLAQIDI